MSFFEKLAHQISANGRDAPRRASWVSITRAGDIDEFRETIRGYRVQLAQIEKGPFVGEAVQSQRDGVVLITTQFSPAVARSGDLPSGKITFAMGTSMMPAVWQGSRLGPHDLLVRLVGRRARDRERREHPVDRPRGGEGAEDGQQDPGAEDDSAVM